MPTAIIIDLQAARMRLIRPLIAPRLTSHLVSVWTGWAFLPLYVMAAAIDGYVEAQRDVLRIVE